MASLNHAEVIGNTGADPEVRYIGDTGNSKVATFSLATKERYKDRNDQWQENTEWHNIVAFGRLADLAEKYIKKGAQLFVEGKLRTCQWTDQSGQKHNKTDIVADNIQLLGSRQEQNSDPYVAGARQMSSAQPQSRQGATIYAPPAQTQAPAQGDMFTEQPTDDLPF